jgi:hypothetical protein
MGATVGPRSLEPVGDLAIGGPRQLLVREHRPGSVAEQPLGRLPIVVRDHHPGVQGVALALHAQAFDTAHGRVAVARRTTGRRRLGLNRASTSTLSSTLSSRASRASLKRRRSIRSRIAITAVLVGTGGARGASSLPDLHGQRDLLPEEGVKSSTACCCSSTARRPRRARTSASPGARSVACSRTGAALSGSLRYCLRGCLTAVGSLPRTLAHSGWGR